MQSDNDVQVGEGEKGGQILDAQPDSNLQGMEIAAESETPEDPRDLAGALEGTGRTQRTKRLRERYRYGAATAMKAKFSPPTEPTLRGYSKAIQWNESRTWKLDVQGQLQYLESNHT